MIRLFLADVHANLAAFEAVLEDAGQVDEILFLGDIVGCGPHPAECVDRLLSLNAGVIAGNHDLAIVNRNVPDAVPSSLVNWDDWTYCRLTKEQRDYLSSLPLEMTTASCAKTATLIHRTRADYYLHPSMPDHLLKKYFRDIPGDAVYCGHSHRTIDRVVDGRRLVCLPSIGQPRNRDPRAGYAIEIDAELQFRFVDYDVDSVVADLRRIGLPEDFRARWERFLQSGFDPEWSREPPSTYPSSS